ncbi:MAG: RagB/SusD family nutrient uptake outer membrane protein [Cyclobacteriaceae bacterium]|nr:RagB/SusD family nutrient uptake outer membrane protein [Cyclobacteriaceae bacterium]
MKRFISIIFITVLAGSCSEDFLDRSPLAELTEATFMTNENDAFLATNAIYNTLRNWRISQGGFPVLDIMSDDAAKGSNPGDGTQILPFDNFSFDPTDANLLGWYSTLFQAIRRANIVLEKVPGIDMDEELKSRLLGEASVLRALAYFDLVRGWGDVPKITTSNPALQVPRSPMEEIYEDIIIPDLEYGYANLPEKSGYEAKDLGRVTKGVARGLLAKVYLFLDDFTNAEKYSLEVINSGQYDLMDDFSMAFSVAGEFGDESVFEIPALPENFENGGNQYANTQAVRGTPNRGWGFNRPTLDLINAFDPDDPRMDKTITFLGEVLDGVLILGDGSTPDSTYNSLDQLIQVETYNEKIWTPGTTALESWQHNRRVLRYADILLMAAESLNENGNPSQALEYLNMVRERARDGIPGILPDITTTDQDELRDAIMQERRLELALEGHRFFDLVRTGRAAEVLGLLGFVEGKHELLPIPQTEIDLSQGILTQNPGW